MRFLLPFSAWFLLGFVGIAVAAAQIPLDALRAVEGAPQVGDGALRALLILQPSALLALGVAVGVALSGRARLRSWLTDRLRGDPPPEVSVATVSGALALAAVAALAALAIDVALRRVAPEAFAGLAGAPLALEPRIGAMLYGGITEELMLRYGLMTALVAALRALLRERVGEAATAWPAILVVALVFGVGHLPALAAVVEPNALLVARTVALNAMLGTLYGYLYWRSTLEHAIAAHAFTHGVFWLAGPLMASLAGL